MKNYSVETRREVIRLYFQEGLGARRIVKRLDLSSTALVRQWVIKYIEYGEDSFVRKRRRVAPSECSLYEYQKYCDRLERENRSILAENTFLKAVLNADTSGKYGLIDLAPSGSISEFCRLGEVSRSGFYKWKASQQKRDRQKEYSDLLSTIREIYDASKGTYGYRRIDKALRERGIVVNHKRLQKILRENDMRSKLYEERKAAWKSDVSFPNLLRQNFTADHPNEKWTTDFTSMSVSGKQLQLMCIMDLYNGKIVYHDAKRSFTAEDASQCVRTAVEKRGVTGGLILHSDRGAQFKSKRYSKQLKKLGIRQSMSRAGNCFDNARIESFFSHMKAELPIMFPCSSLRELRDSIDSYIDYYNNHRIRNG